MKIDRIYFLIHPTCWAMSGGRPSQQDLAAHRVKLASWYAAYNWEQRVIGRQKDFIDHLGPNDALIIHPIGDGPAMRQLEEHASRALGKRCIIQKAPIQREPQVLYDMQEPIRHFLDDEQLPGRAEFWEVFPSDLRDEIEAEIRDVCAREGYDWQPSALKVVAGNRAYAREITDELAKRGLEIDPATLRCEAFGDGFEECAMTWKSMIPHYLGWTHPVENNFELSVSGAPVLFDATFKQRIPLEHDVRLFLWEKSHGLPLAMFARCRARLADPHYQARIPLHDHLLEVRDMGDRILWPGEQPALKVEDGSLKVPVLSGIRKLPDAPVYIIGCNLKFEQFRELLVDAGIVEKN